MGLAYDEVLKPLNVIGDHSLDTMENCPTGCRYLIKVKQTGGVCITQISVGSDLGSEVKSYILRQNLLRILQLRESKTEWDMKLAQRGKMQIVN